MNMNLPFTFRLRRAGVIAAAACLVLAPVLVKNSRAFTLIELQFFFPPESIGVNQGAEVALNNTFGGATIRATINWGDAVTGQAIGLPFVEEISAGHGAIVTLPAVQTSGNLPTVVVARVTLTGVNGAALPRGIQGQVGAALLVFDKSTHSLMVSQLPYMVPAVQ